MMAWQRRNETTRRAALVLAALGWSGLAGPAGSAAARKGKNGKGKGKGKKKRCKVKGDCVCNAGEFCHGNGGCGLICDPGGPACPDTCSCTFGADGLPRVCTAAISAACANAPQACEATDECPAGTVCRKVECAPGSFANRCAPLCAA